MKATEASRALQSFLRGGIVVRPERRRLHHGRGIKPQDMPHVLASLQADVERIVRGRKP